MPSQRVSFENSSGVRLSGIIDLPEGPPNQFALFAHCFTCTKDLKAIVRISRHLAKHEIGVLRFDFTGLGGSAGQFCDSNFQSNVSDIISAVEFLASNFQSPSTLIGHSLGGTAMIVASKQIPSARSLVTLASPANTHHLVDTLLRLNPHIERDGQGEVVIGGRSHLIKAQLLDSLRNQDIESSLGSLSIPHLIFHSPKDETLSINHGHKMFESTGESGGRETNYRAFVTLPGSDHLFVNQAEDIPFVGSLIANWCHRFI